MSLLGLSNIEILVDKITKPLDQIVEHLFYINDTLNDVLQEQRAQTGYLHEIRKNLKGY
jgi:hypothetical protein